MSGKKKGKNSREGEGKKPSHEESVEQELLVRKLKGSSKDFKKRYETAIKLLEVVTRERDVVRQIQEISTFKIEPKKSSGTSESTAIILASDWHIEERVKRVSVNGLNEYTLSVAKRRAVEFFKNSLRIIQILQKDTTINTSVLALLGDFISGNIHGDIAENVQLGFSDAVILAEELIISGIEFLLANSELNLVIPCHSGNHARITDEQRWATENENSFEYLMYHNIASYFKAKGEKRVSFIISPAYHSYVEVYDKTIRFHHGHALRYAGGIGGIFIPAYKAIAQWNMGRRADVDCFGHFHQMKDGGNFLSNGSMIGFNPYAISIKAGFEKPTQTLFLIDKKRGRTATFPIVFDVG